MNSSPEKNKMDLKCIWMSAGIVNYKLCDKNMNCEECDFDRVMQGMLPSRETETATHLSVPQNETDVNRQLINSYLSGLLSGCKIHLDRCYHPSHFWYKAQNDNTIDVGLDSILLKILDPLDRVILPERGESYHTGQLIAWIVRKQKTLPLHSPLKGEVVEINPAFLLNGIDQILEEDSYLFKLKDNATRPLPSRICTEISGLQCIAKKVAVIQKHLQKAFAETVPSHVGVTLADGGNIQIGLEKVIGEKAFNRLLKELF